ncbi:MAG: 16S rRNA (uracil(1498)-N(3))-methyltransferase [Taibaiella sp.]|nr:16S rRNA (uracil(1498)-N(3))-methyltransferase [Taibaiella sp.]
MASLPQFYYDGIFRKGDAVSLQEDTARHVVNVLRMKQGNQIALVNGNGLAATAAITTTDKKRCSVNIQEVDTHTRKGGALHLCVAFTKNASRNEWLLEKATELGAASITPLLVTRTERESNRYDRWRNILVSAMLQSQQYFLPELHDGMSLLQAIGIHSSTSEKFIAHCAEDAKKVGFNDVLKAAKDAVIMIGPEGDFTQEEVNLCVSQGYVPVSLGKNRLRTETAAIAVCAYFNMVNNG